MMSIAGTPVTFAQMRDRSCAAANVLAGLGVRRGDTVALFTGDVPRVGVLLAGRRADRGGDRRGERRQQGRIPAARAAAVAAPRSSSPTPSASTGSPRSPTASRHCENDRGRGDSLTEVLASARTVTAGHRPGRAGRRRRAVLHVGHHRTVESGRHHMAVPVLGRPPRWPRRGSSARATCCGPRCRCFTSAPRPRCWRRC